MKRVTFKVLLFIKRTKKLKDGTSPIFARITVNSERAEFSLHESIEQSQWNNLRGCIQGKTKNAIRLNSYFEIVKAKLHNHRMKLEEYDKEVTALNIKNSYLGIDTSEKTILEVFDEHNVRCENLIGIDFAAGTYERYKAFYNHVERFIEFKYHKKDLKLHEVTHNFIKDFEFYLKTERSCAHNTATKYLKNFKKITKIALANGWLKADPFLNIKFHLDEVDMDFLNEIELTTIMEKKFEIERLQQVKDIYIFCCFTGLAFVDVKSLAYTDIQNIDGKYWVKKKRQKTKNWCNIPL